MHRHTRLKQRIAQGSLAVLGLVAAVVMMRTSRTPLDVQYLFVSVIFGMAIVELAFRSLSARLRLKAKVERWWQQSAIAVLIVTTCVAGLARFEVLGRGMWVVLIPLLAMAWYAIAREAPRVRPDKKNSKQWIWWVLTAVVIAWGAWIRIEALDSHSLQGDEYFHVNTAKGWVETGEFVQWDWLHEEPLWERGPYTRAWPYTLQVAASIQLFGDSEAALRLPAFLWGMLFMVLVPLFAYRWTRSAAVAALVTACIAFDSTMIWQSTFSRMYSMLFVLTLVAIHALYRAVSGNVTLRKRRHTQRWAWLALAWTIAAVGYVIHPVSVLLIPASMIAIAVAFLFQRDHGWLKNALLVSVLLSVIGLALLLALSPSDLHFVVIRAQPQLAYAGYAMTAAALPVVMCTLFLSAGAQSVRKKAHPAVMTTLAIYLPIWIYFIFFANRYSAKKYIAFIIVLLFFAVAWMWNAIFSSLVKKNAWLAIGVFAAFLWVLTPFSIPGAHLPGVATAPADRSYRERSEHDYQTVYAFLEKQSDVGDVLVLQGTKHYYLNRKDLSHERISLKTPLTVQRMRQIRAAHEHGYIALSRLKNHLLTDDVRQHIRDTYERVNDPLLAGANVIVYRW